MARLARAEVFGAQEIACVHVIARVVRRCFLLGDDPFTGINYDHRKDWIEQQLLRLSAAFGIDLLCFAVMSNHFHLVLRSRPDVVETWDDSEVARRWLSLCPIRKKQDGSAEDPNEFELNSIRNDPDRIKQIRLRLSDIAWWMRLLCQNVAMRANKEDQEVGKFWQARYRAVRILDEESLLACAAYVDLNPIRAAIAETLEESDYTSVQRRIQAMTSNETMNEPLVGRANTPDSFIAPLTIDEQNDPIGPCASIAGTRCSDKGFLSIRLPDYLELLDATARIVRADKLGFTPPDVAPIFERLNLDIGYWTLLAKDFGRMFGSVAGTPKGIYEMRSLKSKRRFYLKRVKQETALTS